MLISGKKVKTQIWETLNSRFSSLFQLNLRVKKKRTMDRMGSGLFFFLSQMVWFN
ncbi:unnamed protein product [Brassica rapa subsp. trilocularis]